MPYAELHCKTNFSFLEGAAHADELVQRAHRLGYHALAVTDRATLAGVVRAHQAAKDCRLKLIIGADLTLDDGPRLVLWAPDREAYGRLTRLLTVGRRRAEKGACRLRWDDLADHAAGLLGGWPLYGDPGGPGQVGRQAVQWAPDAERGQVGRAAATPPPPPAGGQAAASPQLGVWSSEGERGLDRFRELFGDRAYLLAALHRGPDDAGVLQQCQAIARRAKIPLAAAGDVYYHVPARLPLQDVLTAIRHHTTVAEVGRRRLPNAQRHLRTLDEIRATFHQAPALLARTVEIADRCRFSLDELRYEYPRELAPDGLSPREYLQQLAWRGAHKRYPRGIPAKVRRLLEHELTLIGQLQYEAYFLTVWDLVRFARNRQILCQGRGSAANSAVCYCLGITSVDPNRMDVLFERFVSKERDEAPDIDVDFEHERREEVLQYIYQKYGRERAGMTAEVITYRSRSAVRDVGKALGLSLDRVDALAKQVEGYADEPRLAQRCREVGIDPESELGQRLIYLVGELTGFPRHLSQHVGGMVMTRGPLCELVPIENAAMPDRTVIQWDKNDLDALGVLKVDCLALGMLTAIHRAFDLIERHAGRAWTLATVPAEDPRVYEMICRADTMGVFQIESRAQMSMLPRLKPRCYYDLVIEVAIVRPGPIQGQMVHPYLRRRAGAEPVTYPNEVIRDVLHKTLGVPIFQEQAMRLAVVAAGFTPGEADQLRRAMGAWRRPGVIDQFRCKLLDGMQTRGLSREFAEQGFQQIRGFGEYGFPESHAASFALLVYVSAWIKHYYPAAFVAALINSQPMGFYAPAQLVSDARKHGVAVRPVDVNFSCWDCCLEADGGAESTRQTAGALRLGFRMLRGIPRTASDAVERERAARGLFPSVRDFLRRTRLSRAIGIRLAEADVFQSLGVERRRALWEALDQDHAAQSRPLLDKLNLPDELCTSLPEMSAEQQVLADYQTSGLSLKAHPLAFHRQTLDQWNVVAAHRLPRLQNGRRVCVAGLVLLRQRPSTAKGITFVTLEDETGTINLILHQKTWEAHYTVARRSPAWLAHGRVETKDNVTHVIVHKLEDLSLRLGGLAVRPRDFR